MFLARLVIHPTNDLRRIERRERHELQIQPSRWSDAQAGTDRAPHKCLERSEQDAPAESCGA